MDSVIVQSPLLKKALGRVLHDYPGVTTSLDRLTFRAPFKSLVHRWANLVSALEEEQDVEAKAHLDLFHRTMKEELQDDLKARDDYILNRVITWNTCWMIFEPATIVFTADDKEDRALRLKSGSYITTQCGPAFALDCDYVDWDGEHFGLGSSRKLIHEFAGTKPITKLTAFPLKYHENLAEVTKTLTERGERFEALSGYRYKHYQGVAVGQGAWGPVKYNVDSRIILDTYAWNRFNPNRQISLGPLNQAVGQDNDGDDAEDRSEDEYGDASLDALLAQGTHQPRPS
ncbi:hypothetical protein XPA_006344 [Xanthoria parietina]